MVYSGDPTADPDPAKSFGSDRIRLSGSTTLPGIKGKVFLSNYLIKKCLSLILPEKMDKSPDQKIFGY
jgi:hypothetical protein